MSLKFSPKYALLFSIAVIGIVLVFVQGPVPQSEEYHRFADTRKTGNVPNFWNVISNIPFVVIGLAGMFFILYSKKQERHILSISSFVFFLGIFFAGIGSAYYHLYPSTQTLVWDRLPMTMAFMAFFSIIISECMDEQAGKKFLFPFLLIGLFSVYYWQMTELRGSGDLRFYFLVQFLPMVLIPLILLLFKTNGRSTGYFWLVLMAYVIAKVFESADAEVFTATGSISGHSIKHVVAAFAPLIYLRFLSRKISVSKN